MKLLRELWDYRAMIVSLVKRDLKGRYKGSVLGFFWMFLNPLLQLAVYTAVFSVIMRMNIDKFYMLMFVALVPWLFFSSCLSGGTNVIFSQQDMVKKIYFPREVLPISFTLSQFVNMLLSFLVIFVVLFFSGLPINPLALACLPIVMIVELVLCLGVTYITSAVAVYFRDLTYIMNIIAMAWMYLTPIIYPVSYVPDKYAKLFYLNPMTSVTIAYRDILYYGKVPELETLTNAVIMGIVILIVGQIMFSKLQKHFVEEL